MSNIPDPPQNSKYHPSFYAWYLTGRLIVNKRFGLIPWPLVEETRKVDRSVEGVYVDWHMIFRWRNMRLSDLMLENLGPYKLERLTNVNGT